MQFIIESVLWWTYKDLTEHYPCLKKFDIEPKRNGECELACIRINDLKQLEELVSAVGKRVIISDKFDCITIYDNYIE